MEQIDRNCGGRQNKELIDSVRHNSRLDPVCECA